MSYYRVISVRASGLRQTRAGPNKEASDMLLSFGFKPDVGHGEENMNEGAVPRERIIVRYETSGTPFFQLLRVERHGNELRHVQLDSARVLTASPYGDLITIYGNGRRLARWEITFAKKRISNPTDLA